MFNMILNLSAFVWILQDGYYYHCWLDYDTGLMWAQIVPMFVIVFLVINIIFIIINIIMVSDCPPILPILVKL